MTAALFICHAVPDAAFAGDLAVALETFRLSVWRDQRKQRGSERLAPDVRWAIEQARQVIVIIGLNSGDPSWLRREIEVAQEMERRGNGAYRVIPLLLPEDMENVHPLRKEEGARASLAAIFSAEGRTRKIVKKADGFTLLDVPVKEEPAPAAEEKPAAEAKAAPAAKKADAEPKKETPAAKAEPKKVETKTETKTVAKAETSAPAPVRQDKGEGDA